MKEKIRQLLAVGIVASIFGLLWWIVFLRPNRPPVENTASPVVVTNNHLALTHSVPQTINPQKVINRTPEMEAAIAANGGILPTLDSQLEDEDEIIVKYRAKYDCTTGKCVVVAVDDYEQIDKRGKTMAQVRAELAGTMDIEYFQRVFVYELRAEGSERGIVIEPIDPPPGDPGEVTPPQLPSEQPLPEMPPVDQPEQPLPGTPPSPSSGSSTGQYWFDLMEVEKAWELAGNNEVVVAVVDSGVRYTHTDLTNQMWDGNNCVTIDGNELGGCLHGYSYVKRGNGNEKDPKDSNGHGTRVSGVLAGDASSNTCIVGISQNSKIMALEVPTTIATARWARGIDWAKKNGAKIINFSLGDLHGSDCSKAMDQALYDAIRNFGGLVVVAAGNDGVEMGLGKNLDNPSSFAFKTDCWEPLENILVVGGSNASDTRWISDVVNPESPTGEKHSSHYGDFVHVYAPGDNMETSSANNDENCAVGSGTSYSAPATAGVAALLLSTKPGLSASELKQIIMDTVDKPECKNINENENKKDALLSVTGGRVNAKCAMYKLLGMVVPGECCQPEQCAGKHVDELSDQEATPPDQTTSVFGRDYQNWFAWMSPSRAFAAAVETGAACPLPPAEAWCLYQKVDDSYECRWKELDGWKCPEDSPDQLDSGPYQKEENCVKPAAGVVAGNVGGGGGGGGGAGGGTGSNAGAGGAGGSTNSSPSGNTGGGSMGGGTSGNGGESANGNTGNDGGASGSSNSDAEGGSTSGSSGGGESSSARNVGGGTGTRASICDSAGTAKEACLACMKGDDESDVPRWVWTAIGCISTDPAQATAQIFSIALGVGGIFILVQILLGAFGLIVSGGNVAAVEKAKKRITDSVIALLFLVFSVALLQLIGMEIFRLPGMDPNAGS